MNMQIPRLLVAGLSGDSGKTIVSLSLVAALRQKGLSVSVFKKGPDYIDSAWLGAIAGMDCYNLDTYLVEAIHVLESFVRAASKTEVAIIEGNRGLFDGKDSRGSHSSAALARFLNSPVLLVIDASKATRTLAAVVNGCRSFEPDLKIAGIILNRVAGARHEKIIRDSIQECCGIPILGVLPKISDRAAFIPARHLGLVPPTEFGAMTELNRRLASFATEHIEIDRILEIAHNATPLDRPELAEERIPSDKVRIGYFHDSIFTFYYPDNLQALRMAGAELVEISSLEDSRLPEIDALYIGGGFPETQASSLSRNTAMLSSVRAAAEDGLPIFAECGGLMYLCRTILTDKGEFAMAGIFPIDLELGPRPVGHGYMLLRVDTPNPYFSKGASLKAHEFHYSGLLSVSPATCLKVIEGYGLDGIRDGLLYKNTFASYAHFHAGSDNGWAKAMVQNALAWRESRQAELV
jgi:cobyrinic acid a,c-diamide synthase